MANNDRWMDTNSVVSGDIIKFDEAIYGGTFRKPKFIGNRNIIANVVKESYGAEKQQHTFTLEIISSSGKEPLAIGKTTRRKGRNIYKNGVKRLLWDDENERQKIADEKHARGDEARAQRDIRLSYQRGNF